MTKEEFYLLAEKKPEISNESIYKLTVRYYQDGTTYRKTPNKQEWSYRLITTISYYSSKENAMKAYRDFIKENENINSALIQRIAIDKPIEESTELAWWVYDSNGQEIDKSVCTSLFPDVPTINDVYMGRDPEQIPYKMGEIVEVIHGDRVHLEILNGTPLTIEECWKKYEDGIKIHGENLENDFGPKYFFSPMADQYYYIDQNGFDPDIPPYNIMKPLFPLPKKIQEVLTERFNKWKNKI